MTNAYHRGSHKDLRVHKGDQTRAQFALNDREGMVSLKDLAQVRRTFLASLGQDVVMPGSVNDRRIKL